MPYSPTPHTRRLDVPVRLAGRERPARAWKPWTRREAPPLASHTAAVHTPVDAPERWHVAGSATVIPASLSEANLQRTLERVTDLVQEAEADDETPPASHAIAETRRLLREALPFVRSTFPRAAATSDGRGWVHLFWRTADRMVQLTVPSDSRRAALVYHSDGERYDIEKPVTPAALARWIDWFASA